MRGRRDREASPTGAGGTVATSPTRAGRLSRPTSLQSSPVPDYKKKNIFYYGFCLLKKNKTICMHRRERVKTLLHMANFMIRKMREGTPRSVWVSHTTLGTHRDTSGSIRRGWRGLSSPRAPPVGINAVEDNGDVC